VCNWTKTSFCPSLATILRILSVECIQIAE
jgi:hypothetical protein